MQSLCTAAMFRRYLMRLASSANKHNIIKPPTFFPLTPLILKKSIRNVRDQPNQPMVCISRVFIQMYTAGHTKQWALKRRWYRVSSMFKSKTLTHTHTLCVFQPVFLTDPYFACCKALSVFYSLSLCSTFPFLLTFITSILAGDLSKILTVEKHHWCVDNRRDDIIFDTESCIWWMDSELFTVCYISAGLADCLW